MNKKRNFKNWFSFCWGNLYILYFAIGLIAQIVEIVKFEDIAEGMTETAMEGRFGVMSPEYLMCCMGVILPLAIMATVAYKGMYQHWMDWTHDRTR